MAIKDQAIGAAVGVVVAGVLGVIGAAAFGDGGLIRVLNGATASQHMVLLDRLAVLDEALADLGASDRAIENLQDRLVSVSNIEAEAEAVANRFSSLATTLELEAEGQLGQARSRITQLDAALTDAEAITQLSEEGIGAFEAILRGNQDVLQAAISNVVAIPRGGVIAINRAECPEGWSPLQNGNGRMIVGAGQGDDLTLRELGAIGGKEEVRLTAEEMPEHQHGLNYRGGDADLRGSGNMYIAGLNTNRSVSTPGFVDTRPRRDGMKQDRLWVRLREKGGIHHEMPCHHSLEPYLRDYLALLGDDPKAALFRSIDRQTKQLGDRRLHRSEALAMVRRRVRQAGIATDGICNHSFRGTGITAYLQNPEAKLEHAQHMAAHADPKTTRIYDSRSDVVSLDEVERIGI